MDHSRGFSNVEHDTGTPSTLNSRYAIDQLCPFGIFFGRLQEAFSPLSSVFLRVLRLLRFWGPNPDCVAASFLGLFMDHMTFECGVRNSCQSSLTYWMVTHTHNIVKFKKKNLLFTYMLFLRWHTTLDLCTCRLRWLSKSLKACSSSRHVGLFTETWQRATCSWLTERYDRSTS